MMALTNPPSRSRFASNLAPLSLLVLASLFALLWKLGAGSLAAWDEAIYAQVSKEMACGGDWLTPHWGYRPWFEKPPLFMWLTALSYRLFGVGEFTARLSSALSGVALVGLAYLVGKRLYGGRVGVLSAVVLLTCYHFLSFARFGTTDVMLTLFTYLAVYGYLRLDGGGRWWYLIWSSCALALMVKGAGGAVAPAAVLLALAFDGRFGEAVRSGHFWRGILLASLIVAPWHLFMYVRYGRAFLDEYVGYHVVARSTRALEGHASGYLYYIGKLVDGFFPWCLLVPFAAVSAVRGRREAQHGSLVLPLLAALAFGLYTMIPTRRPWYIVPVYPALAVLVAAFVIKLRRAFQPRSVRRRLAAVAGGALVVVGGLYSVASLYLGHRGEEAVAKLSRLARSERPDDKEPLLLHQGVEPIYAQIPLFYSDRPARQTYTSSKPGSVDAERYVDYENLSEVAGTSPVRIILRREDIQLLSADYDIRVLAEVDPLAYATIKRRE